MGAATVRAMCDGMTTAITSPCIQICTLDTVSGLCLGCGRSGAEIAGWIRFSEAERAAVMAALPARRRALDADIDRRAREGGSV